MKVCPACLSTYDGDTISAKEMLIGTRKKFTYNVCNTCNSLTLADTIDDFSEYYPHDYHCFQGYSSLPKWKKFLLEMLIRYNFSKSNIIGRLIAKVFYWKNGYIPEPNIGWVGTAYRLLGSPNKESLSIIDMGCGGGKLLEQLHMLGFSHIAGVEPYGDPKTGTILVHKAEIKTFLEQNTETKYDIIIFSHVFEHLFEQEKVLSLAKQYLNQNGIIILSMPVLGTLYEKFGTHWLSFDAPRHVSLFTERGFASMLKRVGLSVVDVTYEQSAWDIFASEMYEKDISFQEIFERNLKPAGISQYKEKAQSLDRNKNGGGSVTYFLHK